MKLTEFLEKYNLDIKITKRESLYDKDYHVNLFTKYYNGVLIRVRTRKIITIGLNSIFDQLEEVSTIRIEISNKFNIGDKIFYEKDTKNKYEFEVKINQNIVQKVRLPENITYDEEFLFEKYLKFL